MGQNVRWTPSGVRGVRGCSSLCLCWLGRGQRQRWLEEEHKEVDRDPPRELKEQTRQEAKADPPLEEEGWGTARPVTKQAPSKQGASQPGIATWWCMALGPGGPKTSACKRWGDGKSPPQTIGGPFIPVCGHEPPDWNLCDAAF